MKVVGEREGIFVGARDVTGAARPEQVSAQDVHARRARDDSASVPEVALTVDNRQVQSVVIRAIAGGPDDGPNIVCSQVDLQGG